MPLTREGLLLIISGPSGVGKGTVCRALMERNDNMRFSVSCTTRPPRPGEVDGLHYFFKTREEFEQMVKEGAFLEHMPGVRPAFLWHAPGLCGAAAGSGLGYFAGYRRAWRHEC